MVQIITDLLLERGDSILCEEFTYFYMVDSVLPTKGYKAIPMKMDTNGICPQSLRQVLPFVNHLIYLCYLSYTCSVKFERLTAYTLQTLRDRAAMGQLPKALYTVPCGHNPTGRSAANNNPSTP